MKKFFAALFSLALCAPFFSFDFYNGNEVNLRLSEFANGINETLPVAATQQNVYSSAWIGKVFPSAPPHFAIGVEAGVTKLDMEPLKQMAQMFSVTGLPSLMVFPTLTANARVGGLFLPFDVGFSAMGMDLSKLDSIADGLGIQFFNIGGDVRWALLKGDGPLPQISLGAGYYYMGGKVSYNKDGLYARLNYGTHTAFAQAQISKTLLFFTPYVGFRAITCKSSSDWQWFVTPQRIAQSAYYSGNVFAGQGNDSLKWFDKVMTQVYGGFGLNFGFFALNFCASYEFRYQLWGGDFSIRFQM